MPNINAICAIKNAGYNADTERLGRTDKSTDESQGGAGLTTPQIQSNSAYSNMNGFDFTNTWRTVTGNYPKLQ